jgi:hypothetical protein
MGTPSITIQLNIHAVPKSNSGMDYHALEGDLFPVFCHKDSSVHRQEHKWALSA